MGAENNNKNKSAFGMTEPGRNFTTNIYRYGFNGKEKDDEMKGSGNSLDFGARMYDPRVGRWLGKDKKESQYASYSPYHFGYDNPIIVIDPNGEENIVILSNAHDKGQTTPYAKNFYQVAIDKARGLAERDKDEQTTVLVYEGDYTTSEISDIKTQLEASGITYMPIKTANEVINYINARPIKFSSDGTTTSSSIDLVTDLVYVGHSSPGGFLLSWPNQSHKNYIWTQRDLARLNPNAFDDNVNIDLIGCYSAGIGRYLIDNKLGSGAMVKASRFEVYFGKNQFDDKHPSPGTYYYEPSGDKNHSLPGIQPVYFTKPVLFKEIKEIKNTLDFEMNLILPMDLIPKTTNPAKSTPRFIPSQIGPPKK